MRLGSALTQSAMLNNCWVWPISWIALLEILEQLGGEPKLVSIYIGTTSLEILREFMSVN